MKKLILTALLVSTSAFAIDEMVNRDDGNQIASVVKDLEVKKLLEETSEFRDCRDKYPFNASDSQTVRNDRIKLAQDCFKQKIGNDKGQEKLIKLSDTLDLQSYDLVKSKNAKDIQKYLDKKMYQSMTGVDPDQQDKKALVESLKFKNKKHIDQKVFITLWKTQLVKNSLFQISNFCLTKLRRRTPPTGAGATFGEHWKDFKIDEMVDANGKPDTSSFIDNGEPVFGSMPNVDDKEKIYEDLFNSLKVNDAGGFQTAQLSNFFFGCGKLIVPMCDRFKNDTTKVNVDSPISGVGQNSQSVGASACLVKAKLEEYKKALSDTDKYEKAFAEMASNNKTDELMSAITNGSAKVFGKNADDVSLDNLTNYTSKDLLEGGVGTDKASECFEKPENADCEKQFLGDREEFLKAQHSLETEMTLKREVEMARVRDLKQKNDAKLEEYLEQNGYYEILKKLKDGTLKDPEDIAKEVGKEYEAKKIAMLDEMNKKLGGRQLKADATAQEKKDAVADTVKQTKEERSRLAQVVLFNNIITSHLSIERDLGNGKREKAGRNVNAFKKEAEDLKVAKVNGQFFENLKAQGDEGNSQVGQNDQLGGITLIEEMLGKEKKD